ncbi:uncharacterized protein LOC135816693 [Sycon ciliatum]|uniref:uncharacterized protein LOC135816693 n=1 Tax=Sycon ciliatum TaxID=27933 RepID=UPI0031F6632F
MDLRALVQDEVQSALSAAITESIVPLLTQGQGNTAAAATTLAQGPGSCNPPVQPPAPAVPKAVQERILRGIQTRRPERQGGSGHCPPASAMLATVCQYASWAVSRNTRRTYTTGEDRHYNFCRLQHWSPYPATDVMLCGAVRNAHLENGFADPLVDVRLQKRVMKGIQLYHGTAVLTPRLPITMPILRHLIDT